MGAIAAAFLCAAAAAAAVTVTAAASRDEVRIGESFDVVLEASGGQSAAFPELPEGDLELIALKAEGLKATYTVAAFALGEKGKVTFPSLAVTVDGSACDSPAVPMKVVPITSPGDAPRPLRPVPPVRPRPEFYAVLAVAVAALVGLSALAAGLARRLKAAVAGEAAARLSPLEEALAELARLRRGGVSQDELFLRLSAALRRFVGREYGVNALEMTSGEVVGACGRLISAESLEVLGRILAACDLAEFALYRFPASEVASALDDAEAFVRDAVDRPRVEEGGA